MGLIDDLGFELGRANLVQRMVGAATRWRPMVVLASRLIEPADRAVLKLTKGRATATSAATGLPVVWVAVRGRRSGQVREVPLLAFPVSGDLAVIGSNFGRAADPAWVLNLVANPEIEVSWGGRTISARARDATSVEAEIAWEVAGGLVPTYPLYREMVEDREIKVFVLEPQPSSD